MLRNFTAIDFETANYRPTSICSVGLVRVRQGQIVERIHRLIRPTPNYYVRRFTEEIHGIGFEDTCDQPVFPQVWAELAPRLDLRLGVPDQIIALRAHPADPVHHILPALMPYIAKQAVSIFSASILSEASLSFLGCGVPVTIPTLGSMLSEARPVMGQAPWLVAFPALFLFLIGLSLELLVSGRSELDPSSH